MRWWKFVRPWNLSWSNHAGLATWLTTLGIDFFNCFNEITIIIRYASVEFFRSATKWIWYRKVDFLFGYLVRRIVSFIMGYIMYVDVQCSIQFWKFIWLNIVIRRGRRSINIGINIFPGLMDFRSDSSNHRYIRTLDIWYELMNIKKMFNIGDIEKSLISMMLRNVRYRWYWKMSDIGDIKKCRKISQMLKSIYKLSGLERDVIWHV